MDRRSFLRACAGAAVLAALRIRPAYAAPIVRPVGWGVCVPPQQLWQYGAWIGTQELALLEPDRWHSYSVNPPCAGAGFLPLVYSDAYLDRAAIQRRMIEHPGETWLLWNEPERSEQAAMSADRARAGTLGFLGIAWETGAEFQWCGAGIASRMSDADGLVWLTDYVTQLRRRGVSRPSYWHVHLYRSSSVEEFRASWAAWRTWYATWGAGAPVVLSEVCAEAAGIDAQIAVMRECRVMLDRGDVAGVFWFATHPAHDTGWMNAALCSVDLAAQTVALTDLGREWRRLHG